MYTVQYTDTGAGPCEFSFCADSGAGTSAIAVSGAGVGARAGTLWRKYGKIVSQVLTLKIK